MNTPGVKIIGETKHMMGDVTYEIVFDDVHIPCEHLVGEEGQGMREAQNWISRNRVHQA
jgi:alkylation response protein AidB-like acyl-CoA dehydrogenase